MWPLYILVFLDFQITLKSIDVSYLHASYMPPKMGDLPDCSNMHNYLGVRNFMLYAAMDFCAQSVLKLKCPANKKLFKNVTIPW